MKGKHLPAILLLISAAITIILFSRLTENKDFSRINEEVVTEMIPQTAYGIVIDSMIVFREKVKKNQFLSDILLSYGVDYQRIDLLVHRSKPVFDVRRIKAGNHYSLLCSNDSACSVRYFIYEESPTSYIVFDLSDSVHAHKGEKEVEIKINTASGTINSSLWNTMTEIQTDPSLANALSEIYAWTIDFFGLQKGDHFKVIYEELFVEGKNIGIGKVHCSIFHHSGHDFYAFYFVQDSIGDYFDENGQSLRRTFLKAPLQFRRISSHFSHSRLHPILKVRQPHHGVDYAAAYGTPVHTVGDGTVVYAGNQGASGNMVKIRHNGTYTTAYLHLSKFAKGIRQGVFVRQGDVIGYVGSTGRSTGPHLDFRFYKNGQAVDPLKVESPPAEPVKSENLTEYQKVIENFKKQLNHPGAKTDSLLTTLTR